MKGRGWIVVLVGVVLVTAACTVGYLAAPFDSPPNERGDTYARGSVEPAHRIVAVDDSGAIVLVADRSGEVSEFVTDELSDITSIDVNAERKTTFVVASGQRHLVRLKTGESDAGPTAKALALGPIAFPRLARSTDRPDVERIASIEDREGPPVVMLENLETGGRQELDDGDFATIDDVALSPLDNMLFGVADDNSTLFSLRIEESSSLKSAKSVEADGIRYRAITSFGTGLAALIEQGDGTIDLVSVDRRSLGPGDSLLDDTFDGVPRSIDADAEASEILIVTDDDQLWALRADGSLDRLAEGIVLAAW